MKISDVPHATAPTKLETTRQLMLAEGRHLAAASGLVKVGNTYWVVADDELHIGRFSEHGDGELVRIFPGELPSDHKQRKAQKPDLEALVYLDRRQSGLTHDVLLAIGSGSRPVRYRGATLPVTPSGEHTGPATVIDLSLVYTALSARFRELNIEGAAITGNVLRLAQRGNGKGHVDALVDLDLAQVAQALRHNRPIPKSAITLVKEIELGDIDGTPLSITDLAALPDGRMVFTAAAEVTGNTYDDGDIKGSGVGVIDKQGVVMAFTRVTPTVKLEGVHVLADRGRSLDVALVCDPDNRDVAATLYKATISLH